MYNNCFSLLLQQPAYSSSCHKLQNLSRLQANLWWQEPQRQLLPTCVCWGQQLVASTLLTLVANLCYWPAKLSPHLYKEQLARWSFILELSQVFSGILRKSHTCFSVNVHEWIISWPYRCYHSSVHLLHDLQFHNYRNLISPMNTITECYLTQKLAIQGLWLFSTCPSSCQDNTLH